MRREGDREIALADSRDPSISGSRTSSASASAPSTSDLLSSSTSCISRLDHTPHVTRLPMDYTDLKLDHHQWKTMLPPDKHEAVWRSASLSFFLDPGTGKNCFTLGVEKLVFLPERWEMKSHPKSRFAEVAVPRYSWGLDVRGRINTRMLSPETLYEAYLVFELADKGTKMEYFARARVRNFFRGRELDIDRPGRQEKMVSFQPSRGRDDGWMEIQLGCFYVDHGLKGEVEARLLDINYRMDIVVEGIEFRPMRAKKSTKAKGILSNFWISST
ncbi:F-box protein PP2-B5 [Sesamum angolense]|uniref:F-box protein PP2-B5 n=1 Tax=Sesamum angolense TaxID=2727404 RepID=A0AAE1X6B2_9LAMI|nr:F-box protein PP2-B5 [Sesamum angolense]